MSRLLPLRPIALLHYHEQTWFIDPIIQFNDASLTMIFGYSGHGKSMFARNMLYAACVGKMNSGPFILTDKPRVLYLDLKTENETS